MSPREESRIHIEGLKPADVALLKTVAVEAAEQAVSKTLIALGLDATKPLDAQKDMMWLRATRERCEGSARHALTVTIGLAVAGVLGALWVGFKAAIK